MYDQARRDPPGSIPDRSSDREGSANVTSINRGIDGEGLPAHLSPEIQARGLARAAQTRRCSYLKPSGERCGSPAMSGFDLCYYHDRYRPKDGYRNLPCLEDAHSVQCAIQEIIEDMLVGFLDYKKAALALYGLQTAASNLKQMRIADEKRGREEKACTVDRVPCTEETACTVDRVPCTKPSREATTEKTCTVDRVPCTEPSRAATTESSPARSAGNRTTAPDESRRDDWNVLGGARLQSCRNAPEVRSALAAEGRVSVAANNEDELEEIELACDPLLPTTTDHRPTTLIESPRPPQHVTSGLRTQAERAAMKQRFPDMKKIRAEFLASLTPEERAQMEHPPADGRPPDDGCRLGA
jgi:hypothetical protein